MPSLDSIPGTGTEEDADGKFHDDGKPADGYVEDADDDLTEAILAINDSITPLSS